MSKAMCMHMWATNVVHRLYKVTFLCSEFWLKLCIFRVPHVKFSKGVFHYVIRRMKGMGKMFCEIFKTMQVGGGKSPKLRKSTVSLMLCVLENHRRQLILSQPHMRNSAHKISTLDC